ncbi:hypothetical protein FRC11_004326 [Ceratobasidium sp. 423]|nr:hypothetical protein FRC11_004326 [Ceratobasidium sp. 423]
MSWKEWGEDATRWLENLSPGTIWTPGPRYFEVKISDDSRPVGKLSVFNFHAPAITRHLCQVSSKANAYELLHVADQMKVIDRDNPSIVDNIFRNPVVSRLPYTVMTKKWKDTMWDGWLVDGRYIVGIDDIPGQEDLRVAVYKLQI